VCKLDVLNEVVVEGRIRELENGLGDIVSGGFDWDIVILLEVDTGLLLGWVICHAEKLTLETWISRTSNVLAIAPLAITTTTSWSRASATATTTSRGITVGISVECCRLLVSIPSRTSSRRRTSGVITTRLKVRSRSPVSTGTGTRCVTCKAVSAWGSTLACHQYIARMNIL
jgi:hypothetical protein